MRSANPTADGLGPAVSSNNAPVPDTPLRLAAQGVDIVEPVDARIVIDAGKSFTLKCVGDVETDLMWTYNDQPLSAGGRILGESLSLCITTAYHIIAHHDEKIHKA